MNFTFYAHGHPAVLSNHRTTLEITKESGLSTKGDCVVAVNSLIGARDLPENLKRALTQPGGRGRLTLRTGPFQFVVAGEGDPRLRLSHPTDLVVRKSGFISDRTLFIHADRSASDLPREMVRLLQDSRTRVEIEISATTQGRP